jgi:hypothetical protein
MEYWIFGNPDLAQDILPLKLIPKLQAAFPKDTFVTKDPLDEWGNLADHIYIIDTVIGLATVQKFTTLDQFERAPSVTMHDFDLITQLRFLQKLGKLKKITLYGVPDTLTEDEAFTQLEALLRQSLI